ncbi:MAG: SCF ubiquitin ligase complex subunit cdc4 [Pleopsidium flavum]|nr:MAG: SCF ubiquitin ligase complex subunit cdc4 [Pleopsidium flavum]
MDPPILPSDITSDITPPVGPSNFLSFDSTAASLPSSPSSSRSMMGIEPQPHDDKKDSVIPSTSTQDVLPYGTLGQLSLAPATQTTVVTTTTTTTTNFPPFLIKAPGHLHNLDPKLYPLAATPTPQSMKRFCFDMGGKPTFFREAEDAGKTLQEFKQHQEALLSSDGILQSVATYRSNFETPDSRHVDPCPLSYPNSIKTPRTGPKTRQSLDSAVSISEAAQLAKSQRKTVTELEQISCSNAPDTLSVSTVGRRPSHLFSHVPKNHTPVTPDTDNGTLLRAETQRAERMARLKQSRSRTQQSPISLALEHQRASQRLNPLVASNNLVPAANPTATTAQLHHAGEESNHASEVNALVKAASDNVASATPPISAHASQLSVSTHGKFSRAARPPRPTLLDTTAAQDLSLPSPSLSPVTAAANLHHSSAGYFDDAEDGQKAMSNFEVSALSCEAGAVADRAGNELLGAPSTPSKKLAIRKTNQMEFKNQQLPTPTPTLMDIPMMLESFEAMPSEMKTYVMYQLLRRCPKPALQFVADVISPALKCDFLSLLPIELGLNIVKYLDVKTLCRAAQVSKRWRHLVDSNENAWKQLFDRDGYVLPEGELQRAIREGWGWQYGQDNWERDISTSMALRSDSEWSTTPGASCDLKDNNSKASEVPFYTPLSRRPKRKAAAKSSSRKQQKRKEVILKTPDKLAANAWMDQLSAVEGPYAAATAAALAVPYPSVGLPSIKNLHLYKSIYQRHHLIQRSWMQDDFKPRHIAFRAHQRHVVTCLQFDTDKILTGSDDTNINVYDTQTGALRARLQGHEGGVWALQYEGNVLVSGSTDRSVRVWDIEKGVCTQVFQGHTSTVRCLQILMPIEIGRTVDGEAVMMPPQPLIITGSRDSNLRVWKLPQPQDKTFFQAGPPQDDAECPYFVRMLTGHHHSVRAIAAHADTLVSGSYDCTVRVWRISTGETVHRLQGHTQKVYSIVLDHKRNRCISGSMDNLVKVWSLDTGSVLYNLEGHSSLVGLLDLHDDRLVSAAADSTLRIWDPENGQCKSTLSAHTGAITCFQHDGQKVISGSDRTLKMWNVKTGDCVKDLLTDLSGVWQVKFNERRCVAAVQRNNLTYIEVLDFGAFRDGVPENQRGKRIVVNVQGQEAADPPEGTVIVDAAAE